MLTVLEEADSMFLGIFFLVTPRSARAGFLSLLAFRYKVFSVPYGLCARSKPKLFWKWISASSHVVLLSSLLPQRTLSHALTNPASFLTMV
jgi:hypothetical protein